MDKVLKAIAVTPGTTNISLVDRPEPTLAAFDQVKVKIVRVGICGTDREEAAGGRSAAPDGSSELIIGHEMFGRVVETGDRVSAVRVGDLAVFTVRRSCRQCAACSNNRSDMCYSGLYEERGIWKLDGYQTEFVVDQEQFLVKVPGEIAKIGVLAEPMSVAEKAIDESVRLQIARLPDAGTAGNWLNGKRCLVAGLGPIGLLAATALLLRGAEVHGLDIVDESSVRPKWLEKIGGHYVDGRQVTAEQITSVCGPMDLIFEATGVPALAFNLLDALALNGIYVLTGIPAGDRPLNIPGAELIRRLVLDNQVMIGSVNAARDHYQLAVDDLHKAQLIWGDHLAQLITHRHPSSDFAAALEHHGPDEIKVVIEWE